jgi:hypothetical protein
VPIHDDEQFERYLRQFRPTDPTSLPTEKHGRLTRRGVVFAATGAAAAAALVVLLTQPSRPGSGETVHGNGTGASIGVERLRTPSPLTIHIANSLLAQSPSVRTTLDRMAFQSQSMPVPEGKHSAFAVLSKENDKL